MDEIRQADAELARNHWYIYWMTGAQVWIILAVALAVWAVTLHALGVDSAGEILYRLVFER